MLRVTIKDQEQTISFRASEETALRLVAGCSGRPASLGELLVATDVYERGLAARVMADLMEFDKALHREGPAFIHAALQQATGGEHPLEMTFQVVDEATERAALEQRGRDLVIIDLARQVIRTSESRPIPSSGEVRIHDGNALTERTVTYILPAEWKVQAL